MSSVPVVTTPPPPPPPPPPSSGDAAWFHIQPAANTVAPSSGLSLMITPILGKWPVTGTFVLASNKAGGFSTIVVPNGTTSAVTCTFTPSVAGYHLITASNTLGIKNPGYVGISVFATAAGSAGTITQNSTQAAAILDVSIWERDVRSGTLGGGWSSGFDHGWGRFDISLTLSASTSALIARLYKADLSAAINSTNASTAGQGVSLHGAVQVAGALGAGAQAVSINLPAVPLTLGDYFYLELSTDGATWYRVPKRLGMGQRIGVTGRSYEAAFMGSYGIDYHGEPNYLTMANYALTSTYTAGTWALHDGVPTGINSPGPMELCRIMSAASGVLTGMVGNVNTGVPITGILARHGQLTWLPPPLTQANNGLTKIAYYTAGERDAVASDEWWYRQLNDISDWIDTFAGCPVIKAWEIGDGYRSAANGSQIAGYVRCQAQVVALEASRRDIASATPEYGGFGNNPAGHASSMSKVFIARGIARALLSRENPAFGGLGGGDGSPVGPRFNPSGGTRASGSGVIKLPIEYRNGGTSLVGWKVVEGATTLTLTTATSTELRALFTVRLQGNYYDSGRKAIARTYVWEPLYGVAVNVLSVTINNPTNEVWITLDTTTNPGFFTFKDGSHDLSTADDTIAFSVGYMADYAIPTVTTGNNNTSSLVPSDANGRWWFLADDVAEFGIPYGRSIQREIVYPVAAPSPVAQSVVMNAPVSVVPGGWLELSGSAGTGRKIGALTFTVDGSPVTAAWTRIEADNAWRAVLQAPSGTGTHTVSVPPYATRTFNTAPMTSAGLLGSGPDVGYLDLGADAASLLESYSADNRNAHWTDTGATQHQSQNYEMIRVWDGDSGNINNRLVTTLFGTTYEPAAVNFNSQAIYQWNISTSTSGVLSKYTNRVGMSFEVGSSFIGTCAPITAGMSGDFTVVGAHFGLNSNGAGWPFLVLSTDAINWALAGTVDNGGQGTFRRGTNIIPGSGALQTCNNTVTVWATRYRVSDGLLEAFVARADGSVASSASNTLAPSAWTPKALFIQPYYGNHFRTLFFGARLTGDMTTGALGSLFTKFSNRWAS